MCKVKVLQPNFLHTSWMQIQDIIWISTSQLELSLTNQHTITQQRTIEFNTMQIESSNDVDTTIKIWKELFLEWIVEKRFRQISRLCVFASRLEIHEAQTTQWWLHIQMQVQKLFDESDSIRQIHKYISITCLKTWDETLLLSVFLLWIHDITMLWHSTEQRWFDTLTQFKKFLRMFLEVELEQQRRQIDSLCFEDISLEKKVIPVFRMWFNDMLMKQSVKTEHEHKQKFKHTCKKSDSFHKNKAPKWCFFLFSELWFCLIEICCKRFKISWIALNNNIGDISFQTFVHIASTLSRIS